MAGRGKTGLRLGESAAQITEQLGRTLGLSVDRPRLRRLEDALSPSLADWSLRLGPRPGARVILGGPDPQSTAQALTIEGDEPLQRLHRMLRVDGEVGLGLSLGGAGPADGLRYYRVVPPEQGYELYLCAREALPARTDDATALASICGGGRCTALSARSGPDGVQELALYFAVADPPTLIRILERAMLPVSTRANLFFKGILGLDPEGGRPWPKLWVARGRSGGWRFLYLSRGDPHRRTDAVLLDATEAGEPAWAARDLLVGAAEIPARPSPLIQAVGLKFEVDQTYPSWTLHLSPLELI